jgi:hypothetical protein
MMEIAPGSSSTVRFEQILSVALEYFLSFRATQIDQSDLNDQAWSTMGKTDLALSWRAS